ncbi:MAG: exo-alpha-sialidase [Opitutales bacterium]|nr:exo-alpha-sialidase [Opitutales bacterium]
MTIRKSCIASLVATTCVALAFSAFTASAAVTQSDVDLKSGVWPVMVRMEYNPILQIKVSPSKSAKPDKLEAVKIDFSKTTNLNEVEAVEVYVGGTDVKAGELFGTAKLSKANSIVTVRGKKAVTLQQGKQNDIWVSVRMKKKADISGKIAAVGSQMIINGKPYVINSVPVTQRIGYAITKRGDLGSKNYRIPALVRNPKTGTLIATFDIRYNHAGDLPANIDVGVCRSTDGGNTWTPVESVLSSKEMEVQKGIGDPGILVDEKTGTVWIAALWAPQSGHPIWSSSTGTDSCQECGQMVLIASKNDGKTWGKPINITPDVKRLSDSDTKDWGLLFQGPGAGICTKDGTLIFPAQIWGHKGKGTWGVLVYSKDGGKTWTSSKKMPWGGSESTCVELKDGSIMLNVRQGSPGARVVATTKDLGETWKKFDGENLRQPGNLCQAALLTADGKNLYFSNPNSGARNNMTLKYSKDGGKTWTDGLLYDERRCAGYSTTAFNDDKNKTIGVLYEGTPDSETLFFLSIPTEEIRKAK